MCVIFVCIAASAMATSAEQDSCIATKLDAAKSAFDKALLDFRGSVSGHFDKQEEVARGKGDKKTVDRIKSERAAFTAIEQLPESLAQDVKSKLVTAMADLDRAYTEAIGSYTKGKRDADAASTEREQVEYQKGTVLTRQFPYMAFGKGTVWNGTADWTEGRYAATPEFNYMIEITQRNGETFTGVHRWNRAIEGNPKDQGTTTMKGRVLINEVVWTYPDGQEVRGTLKGNILAFKMTSNTGKGKGTVKLKK